jgi:hypothetical protein
LPSLGHLRAEGMEPLWSPVVATSGKSHPYASAEMRLTKPERLPSVATDCRERCMVSRRVADRCRRLRKTLWGAKNRVPPANPHFSERAPNFDTPHPLMAIAEGSRIAVYDLTEPEWDENALVIPQTDALRA